MCGIAGWLDLDSDLITQNEIIETMSKKLAHRGPDASGKWLSPHCLLAHRRLSVIDPDGGAQPMVRRRGNDSFVIIYNGELYNTPDLRYKLESLGHVFSTNSDTEVLLLSYIEWGTDCVEHLNGIYAFGIWSETQQSLFLARDRFGVKPLFYALRGNSFIFASELKSVLAHPLVESRVDSEGLAEVFALGPSRTPGHGVFKGISEIKPAHCMTFDKKGFRSWRYWKLESKPHVDNLDNTVSTLRTLVKDSIERQLVADVPVCTFLSGGLDSSAITSFASSYFQNNRFEQLNTYSIDYADNERFFKPNTFQPNSDAPWAKRVSEQCNTIHHNIVVDTPALINSLEDATIARDLPGMADIDSSLYLFCREIKKNATVGLSGECADEILGGYPWFHDSELLFVDTFPWSYLISERLKILSPEIIEFIKPQEYIKRRYTETLQEVPLLSGEDTVQTRRREMFYLNITWFMSTLLDRKDRMSMASGLEVRVPYCDHRLVEYVWNIPWEMKNWGCMEKGILRKALSGILPNDVLTRRKSPYPKTHNPSYENAVKKKILEILDDVTSPLLPLVNVKHLRSMAGTNSHYSKPWFGQLMATPQLLAYLIQTDIWLRKYNITIA